MEPMSASNVKFIFETLETKQYQKIAPVLWRFAVPGESLIVICDGKVETIQKVRDDQIVVKAIALGTEAETYAIDASTFRDKYNPQKGSPLNLGGVRWDRAEPQPKPTIDAAPYNAEPFTFIAPWGEEMPCNDGDWLVRTIGKENDIYRIEKNAFAKTYKVSE